MKYYAHIDTNGKILGWYNDEIHCTKTLDKSNNIVLDKSKIPTPNIEVTGEVWQEALRIKSNCYEKGEFIVKDFRTEKEILKQEETKARLDRKNLGIDYTNILGDVYKVSLTNDDANGLIQVKTAFEMGISETNFYFENGTIVPLKSIDDLLHLGQFVSIERNKFFL